MAALFERTRGEWTKLGEFEPFWSVLTHERFKASNIDENRGDFYRTGLGDIEALRAAVARNHLDLKNRKVCVELGCGVGRVSIHLSEPFDQVTGYDISPGNLALARKNTDEFGVANASFRLVTAFEDYASIEPFDLFFSNIVLQHNPPPVSRYILEKVAEKAKDGALLYFRVVTYGDK